QSVWRCTPSRYPGSPGSDPEPLTGSSGRDELGRAGALVLAVERVVVREALRDAHDLAAERVELSLNRLVLDGAVRGEHSARDRADVRNRPSAQGSHRELHGVDRLQPMRPACRADEADDLVVEVRRVPVDEEVQPVERVLEGTRDGALVERAAPDE